jgi:catechol 2,3-dioxygenase-like lactoylglutathione lyase family enzyme
VTTFGYSHLAVSVADLDRSRAFYTQALGFEPGAEYEAAGRRVVAAMESAAARFRGVFLRRGPVLLELLCYDGFRAPARTPRPADELGYAHISLVVDEVDAALAAAVAYGGTERTRLELTFADGLTAIVFVTDPDGNRVEFIAHSTTRERDGHAAFLGLTDLGWPAAGLAPQRAAGAGQ